MKPIFRRCVRRVAARPSRMRLVAAKSRPGVVSTPQCRPLSTTTPVPPLPSVPDKLQHVGGVKTTDNKFMLSRWRAGPARCMSAPGDSHRLAFLEAEREQVEVCVQKGDCPGFIKVALATLNKMGDMAGGGSADAFASSSFLMFAGPCAPTHSTLVRLLRLCFWRSVSAYHARVPGVGGQQHPQSVFARRETNRSGVCLAGQRGFGKTHLLNCAAVAASALLPNFVAVVLDATSAPASHATRNDTRTVLDVLRCQFQDLGFSEIADQTNVSDLLAHAQLESLAVGVFVDEARELYTRSVVRGGVTECERDSSWEDIHTMLQHFSACAVFADSTTLLPSMVRKEEDRLLAVLKWNSDDLRVTLNAKKMTVCHVPGFTTPEQYLAYMSAREPFQLMVQRLQKRAPERLASLVRGFHIITDGCVRDLGDLCLGNLAFDDAKRSLPGKDSVPFLILDELRRTAQREGAVDPFNLPRMSEAKAITTAKTTYAELVKAVEAGQLSMVTEGGHATFTFASPQQFIALTTWSPSIFVSHAVKDFTAGAVLLLAEIMAKHNVQPVLWDESVAQIEADGIETWEEKQLEAVASDPLRGVFILLSEAYVDKLKVPGTGVYREASFIQSKLVPSADLNGRVHAGVYDDRGSDGIGALLGAMPDEFAKLRDFLAASFIVDAQDGTQLEGTAAGILAQPWVHPSRVTRRTYEPH